jgi:hypothetical protein
MVRRCSAASTDDIEKTELRERDHDFAHLFASLVVFTKGFIFSIVKKKSILKKIERRGKIGERYLENEWMDLLFGRPAFG